MCILKTRILQSYDDEFYKASDVHSSLVVIGFSSTVAVPVIVIIVDFEITRGTLIAFPIDKLCH